MRLRRTEKVAVQGDAGLNGGRSDADVVQSSDHPDGLDRVGAREKMGGSSRRHVLTPSPFPCPL
jgi:hypothetical protein